MNIWPHPEPLIVETMYGHMLPRETHEKALERGIKIMAEAGLDPGIDLVLCGYGVSRMTSVTELHSYCGGFPEPSACDNPLNYKISWTWDGVLKSYKRPARFVKDGKVVEIPAKDQFADSWVDIIIFPGLGRLEVIPNGDAVIFAERLGILVDMRDLETKLFAMNRKVGYTASVVAQMIVKDEIKGVGLLTPVRDIPYRRFLDEIAKRGIVVQEKIETIA